MREIRIEKVVLNICVGESGDKLTKVIPIYFSLIYRNITKIKIIIQYNIRPLKYLKILQLVKNLVSVELATQLEASTSDVMKRSQPMLQLEVIR